MAVGEHWVWLAVLLLGASVMFPVGFGRSHWLICALCLVVMGFGVEAGLRGWISSQDVTRTSSEQRVVAEIEGKALSSPSQNGIVKLRLTKANGQISRQVIVVTGIDSRWQKLIRGTTVVATVRLTADGHTIFARALGPPSSTTPADEWERAVERVRRGLRDSTEGLGLEARALVPALVLGDTSRVTPEMDRVFKATGLTHLMAVSGANLSLLLGFVLMVAGLLRVRGHWRHLIMVTTAIIFVLLCHAEPSVLRAAAMGLVSLAALGIGRTAGVRNLCLAILGLLLIDPWLSTSWGFSLSVAATTGILFLSPVLSARWKTHLKWGLADAIAIPIAAQIGTQPLLIALSGTVSVVGILANILAAPLVPPATILGFLAAGFGWWFPALAEPLAFLSGACAECVWFIASLGSGLPGATWQFGVSWLSVVAITFGCGAFTILLVRMRSGLPILLLALGLILVLIRPPIVWGWPPGNWDVAGCDVGQGDAWVFRAGPGSAVIVDTGPDPKLIRDCLLGLGIRDVPLAVITHPHADHLGGLTGVVDLVQTILVGPGVSLPGREVRTAQLGDTFTVGRVRVSLIRAVAAISQGGLDEGESAAENNASLVGYIDVGGLRVLFAGDSEPEAQEQVLDLLGPVDVLLVPHHGSRRQSKEFFSRATSSIALIGVGANNPYGHPNKQTLALLSGRTVFRTDLNGAIAIGMEHNEIRAYVRQ